MCLAIPAQVIDIDENRIGTVDFLGVTRSAAFDLCPAAQPGDYVLIHAGFAIQVLDEQDALETLALIEEMPELVEQAEADSIAAHPDGIVTSARG